MLNVFDELDLTFVQSKKNIYVSVCCWDVHCLIWASPREQQTLFCWPENRKGSDQSAHPRRLISAFTIHCPDIITVYHATCQISIFQLVYKIEQAGSSLDWPSELGWLQVYDMTYWWNIVLRTGTSLVRALLGRKPRCQIFSWRGQITSQKHRSHGTLRQLSSYPGKEEFRSYFSIAKICYLSIYNSVVSILTHFGEYVETPWG